MFRRKFLKTASTVASTICLLPTLAFDIPKKKSDIQILHTNDWHSRIDPFPSDHPRYPGQGGVEYRTHLISKYREENSQTLLLDAGDILQGTPYFNLFGGEAEILAMNHMEYDAATIGNHDFDGGVDQLAHLMDLANFPFVNCNYKFDGTPLNGRVQDYVIKHLSGVKVGITGVGIELEGLVPSKLYGGIKYYDPILEVNRLTKYLKEECHCQIVILLSHLGFFYKENKISDHDLASRTKYVDLILGGHTHTFLDEPILRQNLLGQNVWISQAGWAGLILGKIALTWYRDRLFSGS